ncbi:PTS mannitol transporter subunit IICB [Georgenia muralis]|uniref:PTS system mannitol-specific EIICB component n=1 Tax=Georgenia muralis TaxID=154117 RepID=A0A3N4ZP21_9MICO|nr:PTS mannitol transporter subunit IICB [Georgenia muralis]RPF27422.1 PTS system D-mannitol-specific IIB component (Fru family) /PTS system D-mannitol-specific IIC component (Fru family) [Georgenia muralis]
MSQPTASFRAKLQAGGGFLTGMVIPNMGAFIAWGFITALFIPTGWLPNEELGSLVGPMIIYLLPLLLAYTGGHLVHGQRGGVAGTIGTIGLIVGSDIPMFLGAMLMGPLSALIVKKWDSYIQPKIRPGFEMIVNNFGLGILGFGLAILSFKVIGPAVLAINEGLTAAVDALLATGFTPILALLNEPAKVLFLNNVIDQGIYYPLGMQQSVEAGKSIFFMVASNPGPGLGLLLAYTFFSGSKVMRQTAPAAIIIHFFGGIHEIYFPYVFARPITLIGMILGAASGIATAQLFDAGLVAGPSPGSIFAYLLLTPRGGFVGTIAAVLVATTVSFLVNAFLLRLTQKQDAAKEDHELEAELAEAKARTSALKQEGKDVLSAGLAGGTSAPAVPAQASAVAVRIKKVVFACDAGMGSSTMGASLFRKKLAGAGIPVEVTNTAIEKIPGDADVVVTHKNLAERTQRAHGDIEIVAIDNFLGDSALDQLFARIQEQSGSDGDSL